MQFSGFPLVYTKGSGTFLKFIFDNSNPGCLDCLNSADGNGLNPLSIVEQWYVDNATGPYIGGTQVTITAKGLNWARGQATTINNPYDLIFPATVGGLYKSNPLRPTHSLKPPGFQTLNHFK